MSDVEYRKRRKRLRDEPGLRFRETFDFVPEGPLPPRPHRSGVGGWSTGPDGKPVGPGWPGSGSVWSAADAAANAMTLSNGGLTVTPGSNVGWTSIRSTISQTSGKLYVEFSNSVAMSLFNVIFGFASSGISLTGALGQSNYSVGLALNGAGTLVSTGFSDNYACARITPSINDVFALAIDFTAGQLWIAQNNNWGWIFVGPDPVTGAGAIATFTPATVGGLFPAICFNDTNTLIGFEDPRPTAAGVNSGDLDPSADRRLAEVRPASGVHAMGIADDK